MLYHTRDRSLKIVSFRCYGYTSLYMIPGLCRECKRLVYLRMCKMTRNELWTKSEWINSQNPHLEKTRKLHVIKRIRLNSFLRLQIHSFDTMFHTSKRKKNKRKYNGSGIYLSRLGMSEPSSGMWDMICPQYLPSVLDADNIVLGKWIPIMLWYL